MAAKKRGENGKKAAGGRSATGQFVPGHALPGPGRPPQPEILRDVRAKFRNYVDSAVYWRQFFANYKRLKPKDRLKADMWMPEFA